MKVFGTSQWDNLVVAVKIEAKERFVGFVVAQGSRVQGRQVGGANWFAPYSGLIFSSL
jgi:hypothetical protein